MSQKKRVLRTDFTESEWGKLKAAAALANQTIEKWGSDALRAVLKGAKP